MRQFRLVQAEPTPGDGGSAAAALKAGGRDADTTPMTRFGGSLPVSRPAVALASASSCALVCAAALGAVTPPVVVGAVGAASVTAVLSARAAASASRRDLLAPLPTGPVPTTVTIVAPRAVEVAGRSADPAA